MKSYPPIAELPNTVWFLQGWRDLWWATRFLPHGFTNPEQEQLPIKPNPAGCTGLSHALCVAPRPTRNSLLLINTVQETWMKTHCAAGLHAFIYTSPRIWLVNPLHYIQNSHTASQSTKVTTKYYCYYYYYMNVFTSNEQRQCHNFF